MEPGTNATVDASLTFVQGKSWSGIPYYPILVGGFPPTAALASCKMVFSDNEYSPTTLIVLSSPFSGGSGISILDAALWQIQIPQQNLALGTGEYFWSFSTIDVNGIDLCWETGTIKVRPPIPPTA